MTTYQVLYWHDIPLQVRAKGDGGRASVPLPDRFQEAVDQAAMALGLIGSDDYTDALQWSEPRERDGSVNEVATTIADEIDRAQPQIDWRATVEAQRANS
jgi:hypothetical protein